MAQVLDPRIISVSFQVNGSLKTYTASNNAPFNIVATGTKYANSLQNEAEITITNLDRGTQDYILTETSPYNLNKTPKTITLKAGRNSYGTAVIYVGNIVSSNISQPPDIGIKLKCLTGNFLKGNILSRSFPGSTQLEQICQGVSQDTNTILNFQATNNKNVSNYAYGGGALKQVEVLNSMGGINAFIDDNTLIVKDAFVPLKGTNRILSAETGMIGIPEFTEQGIRVTFLLDNQTTLGAGLTIKSIQYPAVNGFYIIYKLGFNITSRDVPFYFIAEALRRR